MSFLEKLGLSNISAQDKVANFFTLVLIVFIVCFVIVIFPSLPDTIPTHFNGNGEVDGTGGKKSIYGIVGFTVLMAIGLYVLSFKSQWFSSYPVPLTQKNKEFQQNLAASMIRQLNAFITACMCYIIVCIAMIAKGQFSTSSLGIGFIFILFAGLIFILGRYMMQARAQK